MSKNKSTARKNSKSLFYQLILLFIAFAIIMILQLFQTHFSNWFVQNEQLIDKTKTIFMNKTEFSIINEQFWFVELIRKVFDKNLPLAKIRIIYFSIISFFIFILMLIFWFVNDKFLKLILLFILIGGLSNLISRIRNNGKVMDYFTFNFLLKTNFNIEDCFVILGIIMFIFYLPIWSFSQGRNTSPIVSDKQSISTSKT